ncbi:MAG: hypothetical protein ACLRSY_01050 [Acutalibacter sp.]
MAGCVNKSSNINAYLHEPGRHENHPGLPGRRRTAASTAEQKCYNTWMTRTPTWWYSVDNISTWVVGAIT